MALQNFIGVVVKQQPWRYWTKSVFVFFCNDGMWIVVKSSGDGYIPETVLVIPVALQEGFIVLENINLVFV